MSPRFSFFGAGWLHGLLTVGIGVLGIVSVLYGFLLFVQLPVWAAPDRGFRLRVYFTVPESSWPVVVPAAAATGEPFKVEAIRGELFGRAADPWRHWLVLVSALPLLALAMAMLVLLRRIVGSISKGDVFDHANARMMRWIGLLVIGGAAVSPFWSLWSSSAVLDGLTVGGAPLEVDWLSEIDWFAFVSGWIVLIFSEVFRQGARLRDEQTLTI